MLNNADVVVYYEIKNSCVPCRGTEVDGIGHVMQTIEQLCKDSYSFGFYYVISPGYFKYAPSPLFVIHLTS